MICVSSYNLCGPELFSSSVIMSRPTFQLIEILLICLIMSSCVSGADSGFVCWVKPMESI